MPSRENWSSGLSVECTTCISPTPPKQAQCVVVLSHSVLFYAVNTVISNYHRYGVTSYVVLNKQRSQTTSDEPAHSTDEGLSLIYWLLFSLEGF